MDKKIHILWSTIRPSVFIDTYNYWLGNANNTNNIITHVAVNIEEHSQQILKGTSIKDIIVTGNERKGVTYPAYILSSNLKAEDDDIVIYSSDDMWPMKNWDTFILNEFNNYDGCIIVNDKYQMVTNPVVALTKKCNIVSIPIMSFRTLKKLNKIIYHPSYNHNYSDNELFNNLTEMNLLKDIAFTKPEIYIEHKHYGLSKRQKDEHDNYVFLKNEEDRINFEKRKLLPLNDRLKVKDIYSKKLSILICTLNGRELMLNNLIDAIKNQVDNNINNGIEILISKDNGTEKLGHKRNSLLDMANGEYSTFIDDDDMIPNYYIKNILQAIKNKPDCCSLNGIITTDDKNSKVFRHSIKYKTWFEDNNEYYRCPNHWNVVKTSIAKQVRFNDNISFQEDRDYSMRLLEHLKTEEYIEPIMYYFKYRNVPKEYFNHKG